MVETGPEGMPWSKIFDRKATDPYQRVGAEFHSLKDLCERSNEAVFPHPRTASQEGSRRDHRVRPNVGVMPNDRARVQN